MTEVYHGISLNDLKNLLKREVKEITIRDLYDLSFYFLEEQKYLPGEYKKEYGETVLDVMIHRFTSLKNDKRSYDGTLCDNDVENVNELLKYNNNVITYILNIIVIYSTYFLKEPVHPPGTAFPGHVSIYYDGKDYFCPIKKNHINNEKSVCKYCIAKILEESKENVKN